MSALLEVNDLKTYFFRKKQPIPAVDGVDFSIKKGETVALVGESGSGKSITSLSIMGLVEGSGGKIMSGSIKARRTGSRYIQRTRFMQDPRK